MCVFLYLVIYRMPSHAHALLILALTACSALVPRRKITWLPERGSIHTGPAHTTSYDNQWRSNHQLYGVRQQQKQQQVTALQQQLAGVLYSADEGSHYTNTIMNSSSISSCNTTQPEGDTRTTEYPRLGGTESTMLLKHDRTSADGLTCKTIHRPMVEWHL
jgi:hypothetical protein